MPASARRPARSVEFRCNSRADRLAARRPASRDRGQCAIACAAARVAPLSRPCRPRRGACRRPASAAAARPAAAASPVRAGRRCVAARAGGAGSAIWHAPPPHARSRAAAPRRRLRARARAPRRGPARVTLPARLRASARMASHWLHRSPSTRSSSACVRRSSVMPPSPIARAGAPRDPERATSSCASGTISTSGCSAASAARNCAASMWTATAAETSTSGAERARLVECRTGVTRRRHAHLHAGQPVAGRGHFVAEVDRCPHQVRRFRIRMDTMRP